MVSLIDDIYSGKKMLGESGNSYQIDSTSISKEEGAFLQSLIRNNQIIKSTLEIGCAWGISSLFICTETVHREFSHHIIIDPYQRTQWDGVGIRNLELAGITRFQLIEEKSETALPKLLKEYDSELDLIFIDGWHTFDQTLLDIFYSLKLIKVGGIIVVDDMSMSGVRQAVDFVLQFENIEIIDRVRITNNFVKFAFTKKLLGKYLFLRNKSLRKTFKKVFKSRFYYYLFPDEMCSMIAFRKTSADNREWNWHKNEF